MINKDEIIALFRRMYNERWQFKLGKAERGTVDCSGAFVWAYKQFDEYIYHGSNRIARKYVGPMVAAKEGKPGYAAFKWREVGEPEEYKKDGLGDFYHIGLIDEHGTSVYNAKSRSAGFCKDSHDKWDYAAPLLAVDYGVKQVGNGIVTTLRTPLNARNEPSMSGEVIFKIPKGAIVCVMGGAIGGFYPIIYDGKAGYCASDYITLLNQQDDAKEVLNKIYVIIKEYMKGEQHDD